MPAMPGIGDATQKLIPHSLSAALAMSRAMPADPTASEKVDAVESYLPASLNSASVEPAAISMPEPVPLTPPSVLSADELDGHAEARIADSPVSPAQPQVQQAFLSQPVPGPSLIEHPDPSQLHNPPAELISGDQTPLVREAPAHASAKLPAKSALSSLGKNVSVLWDRIFQEADRLLEHEVAERWTPPALLAAWRRGNRQQKLLLAGAGTACFGIFGLILTLAAAHIISPTAAPAGAGSQQQSTTLAALAITSVGASFAPVHAPSAPRTMEQPESDQPPESLLAKVADFFSGTKPETLDLPRVIVVDPDHFGVQVWISKRSGYYYCTDSPYYKKVQPGATMAQRDALQSGYQPKLGQFCN